jgi:NAD(P)-dependent dehydrogenase (short-subunit alcohol dehydrogenase family)
MRDYQAEHWPDQIDIVEQQAQFLNPLLEREQAAWYDMGWSRTPDLRQPELCYVCKQKFFRRHFFYDRLCVNCGDLNYQKRVRSADLAGYRILITGARVKIGYESALRLLRAGAEVIVTSRFPRDTARRYAEEPDFSEWAARLKIYGLDLRQIPQLDSFVQHIAAICPHLDAIINNAAQTVKRPPAYYAHLVPFETAPHGELPARVQALLSETAQTTFVHQSATGFLAAGSDETFPAGRFDEHGQQIDNRRMTSWVMRLEEVSISEMVEVHLVNAIAPAILAGQLKDLLLRSPHKARFVVNVSAAEGQFAPFKNGLHPHTNMAKAALNMLTRTIAQDYARNNIYVNSVDPGWVSDQVPRTEDASRRTAAERLPIDMIDAAARVCDPIFSALLTEQPVYGRLLKDYAPVDW